MQEFKTEGEVRQHVKALKGFYVQLCVYAGLNALFILVWALDGGGDFWPIWPIVIWGLSLLFQAARLSVLPQSINALFDTVNERFPFLKPDWEEQQVSKILKKTGKVSAKGDAPAKAKEEAPAKAAAVEKKAAPKKASKPKAPAVKK